MGYEVGARGWRAAEREGRGLSERAEEGRASDACSLIMLNGPSAGTTRHLTRDAAVTIGRHPSREIPLDDDRASRLHARISYRADRWHLEDCGSRNGTYVNSQLVQQVVLEPGDLIRVGDRLILFAPRSEEWKAPFDGSSKLRATTIYQRVNASGVSKALVEQNVGDAMSRVVRDSAVLCRLAHSLQSHNDVASLARAGLDALREGLDADAVAVWLVGTDGRLRCEGREGAPLTEHVLASLAVEKRKAICVDEKAGADKKTSTAGTAIGIPIPARQGCRGAIECHRDLEKAPFERGDLDFAAVVAHQMGAALENLEHRERLEQANVELRRRLDDQNQLVGSSPPMQRVLDQISRVGPASSNVLVLGESGTGKELIARAIHELSRYGAGPFIAVNCAAFSESLLESELFGHEAGAFTGADRRHVGQFERAHRGTLFLDEVGEMSLACQAKLLRVLEGHSFQRLGGEDSIRVDVRLIAATHRDLEQLVRQKRFREDLYYRLRVIDIRVPPLRDRGEDVIELATLYLERFRRTTGRGPRRLSMEASQALRDYPWPGNVRELKNAVERAVVLGSGLEISPADLGLPHPGNTPPPQAQLISLQELERRHIRYVLDAVHGNKTQACRILGIGRGTLYNKLSGSADATEPLEADADGGAADDRRAFDGRGPV
ncbi:MAG: FHA domain-containing protein [Planctomycetes bacterium]|nr:FHA domain-containing protein [Planctomycetota bacterium]